MSHKKLISSFLVLFFIIIGIHKNVLAETRYVRVQNTTQFINKMDVMKKIIF